MERGQMDYLFQDNSILKNDTSFEILGLNNIQMEEQIIEEFEFEDSTKQHLFQTMLSKIKMFQTPFTEQDLEVDLIIRMKMPSDRYELKAKQPSFDQLFNNTPPVYEEIFNLVEEYINYLVQNNQENYDVHNPSVRARTSIQQIYPAQIKKRRLDLGIDDPIGSSMDIQCNYEFTDLIDTFTLRYNMTMLILKRLCGFEVRSFIMENINKNQGGRSVYLLLSLNHDRLMKLADQYHIKKEIDMGTLDFFINQATDSRDRPLKTNNFFKRQQCKGFNQTIKRLHRDLDISNKVFSEEIKQEAELDQEQIEKFESYIQELQFEVYKLFTPVDLKMYHYSLQKNAIEKFHQNSKPQNSLSQFGSDVSLNKMENIEVLNKSEQDSRRFKKLTTFQKQYIYAINRHKTNPGCEQYMLNLKKRKYIFEKIIALNKKYSYKFFQYKDCFVQFVLPSKHKPFFEKLKHILQYQWYNSNPFGELSLFTKMERIKIAFLNLQQKLKVQNWKYLGAEIYPLTNAYEISGDTSQTFNKNYTGEDVEHIYMEEKSKIKFIEYAWHSSIPFKTNIRAVRDYMGQTIALQLAFKIYIITYLMIMAPTSIGLQMTIQYYFRHNRKQQYILFFTQLTFLCFTYTLFIELWKKYQNKFFNNFVEEHSRTDTRAAYQGPYVRSIINDKLNIFKTQNDLRQKIRLTIVQLSVLTLLVLEGAFFYGIRRLIIAQYPNFVDLYFLSSAHLLFYFIFFLTNRLLYHFFLSNLLKKLSFFLNLAKMSEYEEAKRKYNDYFLFGLELIGPFFFYILQNFNGRTCYSVNCSVEFQYYIIARYIIIGTWQILKGIILGIKLSQKKIEEFTLALNSQPIEIQQTFQFKLSQLLHHIQSEQEKGEVDNSMRDEKVSLLFFFIFYLRFPFCGIFSLLSLFITYLINRRQTISTKKRPIPDTTKILRYTDMTTRIYVAALILNSWSIVFNNDFMEYELAPLYNVFVSNLTQNNMLTFKLVAVAVIFIGFYVLTLLFRQIGKAMGEASVFERRKANKFNNFLKKRKGEIKKPIVLAPTIPLKSIFRTYDIESVIQYKKNKFNFLKKKLRKVPPVQAEQKQKSLSKTHLNLKKSSANASFQHKTFDQFEMLQQILKKQSKFDRTYH